MQENFEFIAWGDYSVKKQGFRDLFRKMSGFHPAQNWLTDRSRELRENATVPERMLNSALNSSLGRKEERIRGVKEINKNIILIE